MTTALTLADRLRTTLPDHRKLNERAAVHGLIEFSNGHWINDPEFQREAMANLTTSRPRIKFLPLTRWLDRVGVLEDLDVEHGRTAVEFLRFVVNLTGSGATLEHLVNTTDKSNAELMLTMLGIALGQSPVPCSSHVARLFPTCEQVSLYAPAKDHHRFVVGLVTDGNRHTSSGEVKTPYDAVASTLALMADPSSTDTTFHVYDRQTGELHSIELNEITRPEGR